MKRKHPLNYVTMEKLTVIKANINIASGKCSKDYGSAISEEKEREM